MLIAEGRLSEDPLGQAAEALVLNVVNRIDLGSIDSN